MKPEIREACAVMVVRPKLAVLGLVIATLGPLEARSARAQGILAEDVIAGSGSVVEIPVRVNLPPAVQIATLQFNVTVVPEGDAPHPTVPISFESRLAPPRSGPGLNFNPTDPSSGETVLETVLVGWLSEIVPPLSLDVLLGVVKATFPGVASEGNRYRVELRQASATSNGTDEVILEPRAGFVTIAPVVTTSTTVTSTTTTSGSSASSTTTTTSASSSSSSTSTTSSTVQLSEVCGNCLDDDGDGRADLEDPVCCALDSLAPLNLLKALVNPQLPGRARLLLKMAFADVSLGAGPVPDLTLQLRGEGEGAFLCARFPATDVKRGKKGLLFRDRGHGVASARGVQKLRVKARGDGSGRVVVSGRGVQLDDPSAGSVTIVLGARESMAGADASRCTSAAGQLRSTNEGGLRFP